MQLLTPIDLGPVRLPNPVVSTPHQTGLVHDHLPTRDLFAYHAARAHAGRLQWKAPSRRAGALSGAQ